jgi:hypothetical protein
MADRVCNGYKSLSSQLRASPLKTSEVSKDLGGLITNGYKSLLAATASPKTSEV